MRYELHEDYEMQDIRKYYAKDNLLSINYVFEHARIHSGRALHLGCGRAEMLLHNKDAYGVDFNLNLIRLWDELGVIDRCTVFDITEANSLSELLPVDVPKYTSMPISISCDFLEHVTTGQAEIMFADGGIIDKIAIHGAHVIDMNKNSRYRGKENRNLHQCRLNYKQWTQLIRSSYDRKHATFRMHRGRMIAEW